ncbi:MAG: immunoglobulin domain-containing protein [Verrucomicrobiales bacterium]|nr:immunoglobulin domain-containing protein [Verrucomicrobiales bacterium]
MDHNWHHDLASARSQVLRRRSSMALPRRRPSSRSSRLACFILVYLSLFTAHGQLQLDWTFNLPANEQLTAIRRTAQGQMMAAGTLGQVVNVIKIGTNGTALWSRRYEHPDLLVEVAQDAATDPNGNIWVVSHHMRNLGSTPLGWTLLRYSADGDLNWTRTVDDPRSLTVAVLVDADSNALVLTTLQDFSTVVFKFAPDGNRLWEVRWLNPSGAYRWLGRPAQDGGGNLVLPATQRLPNGSDRAFLQRIRSNGFVEAPFIPVEGDSSLPPAIAVDGRGTLFFGTSVGLRNFAAYQILPSGGLGWGRQWTTDWSAYLTTVHMDSQGRGTIAKSEYLYRPLCTDCGESETLYRTIVDRIGSDSDTQWNDDSQGDRTFNDHSFSRLGSDPDGSVYVAANYASYSSETGSRSESLIAKLGLGGERLWSTNLPAPLVGDLLTDERGGLIVALGSFNQQTVKRYGQPASGPHIVQQPARQTLRIGERATFVVRATAFPSPRYQWKFNGIEIPAATNAFLTLGDARPEQSGNYQVMVQNELGGIASEVAQLEVNAQEPRISITQGPAPGSILAGGDVTFCSRVTGGPPPALRWLWNGTELPGETNTCLTLKSVQPSDSGTYTLVASNLVGEARTNVDLAVIPAVLVPSTGPIRIALGQCFTLCATLGLRPPYTLQWQQDGANLDGATNACLTLCPSDESSSGLYRLRITSSSGRYDTAPLQVMAFREAPTYAAISGSHPSQEAWIENDLTLLGEHNGSAPNFRWLRNGEVIPGQTNYFLELLNLSGSHDGSYAFVVSNALGAITSAVFRLAVTTAPPTWSTLPPSTLTVREGGAIEIPALARGGPVPHHTLLRSGTNLPSVFGFENLRGRQSGFSWRHAALSDSGNYQVIAGNAFGSITSAVCQVVVTPAGPMDRWTQRNPLPQSLPLHGLTHDPEGFVAVGDAGTLVRSTGSAPWSNGPRLDPHELRSIAFGSGKWVAVGESGAIFVSTNRTDWVRRFSRAGLRFNQVLHVDGRWLAVGNSTWNSAIVAESTDTVTWEWRLLPGIPGLYSLTYGDHRWVAVGANVLLDSLDGRDWHAQPPPAGPSWLNTVAYADHAYVAAGDNGVLLTSDDGTNWLPQSNGTTEALLSVTRGRDRWVVVGARGTVRTSIDRVRWLASASETPDRLEAIDWDGARYVAAGENGTLIRSDDGLRWTLESSGESRDLDGLATDQQLLVAVGKGGTLLTSRDGVHFSRQDSGTFANLHGVAWHGGQWVAVGDPGAIITSNDGVSWEVISTPLSSSLKDVTHGDGLWVAVGTEGTVMRSTDGRHWTTAVTEPAFDLNGVAYGSGEFLVVGDGPDGRNGSLFRSVDGLHWTHLSHNPGKNVRAVAFSDGVFQMAGNDGWTAVMRPGVDRLDSTFRLPTGNLRGLSKTAAGWVFVGNNGAWVRPSTSEPTWETQVLSPENLHRVVTFRGRLVAIGNRGTILQSDLFALELGAPTLLPGGGVSMTAEGSVGGIYELLVSTNLVEWQTAKTYTNTVGTMTLTDEGGGTGTARFYRLQQP